MRGALEPLAGVSAVKIEKGNPDFEVTYDPAKIDVAKLLAALQEAGEEAKAKGG